MHLSTAWKHYFLSLPDREELNKHQAQGLELAKAGKTAESCVKELKTNQLVCFMAVAPVSNEIFFFHHFSQVGGSITNLTKKFMALKGLGPAALAIEFGGNILDQAYEFKTPTWTNLKKTKATNAMGK
eukprot:8869965-Ditylum_brightwellii.AAC.1